MSSGQVLITGATGHLGFRVFRCALEYGYHVKAAVRNEEKVKQLQSHHLIKPYGKQVTYVVVPDILASGAYDKALEGVTYIIHVASPISQVPNDGDFDKALIQPARRGTINILEAAASKGNQIKRIVITSSIVAITPLRELVPPEGDSPASPPVKATDRLTDPTGPFTAAWPAYHASKAQALNLAEAFVREKKPSYDLVYIHPSYIEGRNDLTSTLADFMVGTNRNIVRLALGEKTDPNFIVTNHVDDSAVLHVKALDTVKVPAKSYIVSNAGDEGTQWNDIKEILQRRFPDAVKKGIFSIDGDTQSFAGRYDLGDTEKVFELKFKSFEEQVVSVLEHYLEVYAKEKGSQ